MQQVQLTLDAAPHCLEPEPLAEILVQRSAVAIPPFSITADLDSLENEWRGFERHADCTPFQTFDWLSIWQRCIGACAGVTPVIVLARRECGDLLFILPLAVERTGHLRKLTFLGHALCDYNAPLLAPEFSRDISPAAFAKFWKAARARLGQTYKHDIVLFDKMPERIGAQANPMLALATMLNPAGAHATALGNDWGQFYSQKRSSATRRKDRKKRKKLTEFGEVHFITAMTPQAARETLTALVAQKSQKFQRMGMPDLFAKLGYVEFFASVAANARSLVHVSALQLGSTCAAANLGLTFRGCYYHILTSYAEGPAAHFGPGVSHLQELMRYAIEKGCTRFDFTIGDEPYKLDWSDTKVDLYDHVSGVRLLGHIGAAVISAAFRIKRFIKNSPVIWRSFCWLRSAFGS